MPSSADGARKRYEISTNEMKRLRCIYGFRDMDGRGVRHILAEVRGCSQRKAGSRRDGLLPYSSSNAKIVREVVLDIEFLPRDREIFAVFAQQGRGRLPASREAALLRKETRNNENDSVAVLRECLSMNQAKTRISRLYLTNELTVIPSVCTRPFAFILVQSISSSRSSGSFFSPPFCACTRWPKRSEPFA